ncbi:DUF2306 domain-containing protein [Halosegnis longus]|uniref:hypothetical protein n=1 Tax=Halosegnis longus TaxID=2216012 RepID=UPI00096A2861|nr:hypothetical protein [Salella cibi]
MPTLEGWTLWLHIGAGTVAVLAGLGALVTTKGGWRHRQAGKLFVISMGVVVATVFGLLVFNPTTFRIILTLVAIFSGYFAFSGYRVLSRKRSGDDVDTIDWVATGAVFVACLGLGVWGGMWYLGGQSFGIVMIVFGTIGVVFATLDAWTFRRDGTDEWMVSHLQRMIAAFISTVSAVSAVNLTPILGIWAWLWPTIVGVPLIVYWSNVYSTE